MPTASPAATRPEAGISAGLLSVTLLLGVALVFLTGFAHSETLHNAAHDTRHALAFPCH